ncbi:MAG: hypothetical protein AAGB93_02245 [Planctomycetota bacterium]
MMRNRAFLAAALVLVVAGALTLGSRRGPAEGRSADRALAVPRAEEHGTRDDQERPVLAAPTVRTVKIARADATLMIEPPAADRAPVPAHLEGADDSSCVHTILVHAEAPVDWGALSFQLESAGGERRPLRLVDDESTPNRAVLSTTASGRGLVLTYRPFAWTRAIDLACEGADGQTLELQMPPRTPLRLHAVDVAGRPVRGLGTGLRTVPAGASIAGNMREEDPGTYVAEVLPGDYLVFFVKSAGQVRFADVTVGALPVEETIEVTFEDAYQVRLRVTEGGTERLVTREELRAVTARDAADRDALLSTGGSPHFGGQGLVLSRARAEAGGSAVTLGNFQGYSEVVLSVRGTTGVVVQLLGHEVAVGPEHSDEVLVVEL